MSKVTGRSTTTARLRRVLPPRGNERESRSARRLGTRAAAALPGRDLKAAHAPPVLSEGSEGEGVRWLRSELSRAGHLVLTPNGAREDEASSYFDAATRQALVEWQREKGLPATGVLGPISREVMTAEAEDFATSTVLTSRVASVLPPLGGGSPQVFAASVLGLVAVLQLRAFLFRKGESGARDPAPRPRSASGPDGTTPLRKGASGNLADRDAPVVLPQLPQRAGGQGGAQDRPRLRYDGDRGGGRGGGGGGGIFAGVGASRKAKPAASAAHSQGGGLSPPPNLRQTGVWFVDTRSEEPIMGARPSETAARAAVETAEAKRAPAKPKRRRRFGGFGGGAKGETEGALPKASSPKAVAAATEAHAAAEPSAIQQKYAGALERVRQRRQGAVVSDTARSDALVADLGTKGDASGVFSISSLQRKVSNLNQTVETLSGREAKIEEIQRQVDTLERALRISEGGAASAGSGDGDVGGAGLGDLRDQLNEFRSLVDERVASAVSREGDRSAGRLASLEQRLEQMERQSKRKEELLAEQVARLESVASSVGGGAADGGEGGGDAGWFGLLGAVLGYAYRNAEGAAHGATSGVLDSLVRRVKDLEERVRGGTGVAGDVDERLRALEDAWTSPSPSAAAPAATPAAPAAAPAAPPSPPEVDTSKTLWRLAHGREVLLQGFHWESHNFAWYEIVREKAGQIGEYGFTGVWLPPPSDSIAPQGYLPRDLYDLNTKYGTRDQLARCIAGLRENGVHAMADIVINHRCATTRGEGGKWNRWDGTRMAWDERAICRDNHQFGGRGGGKEGDDFTAAPNIDHSQDFVKEDLKEWLRWLLSDEVGFRSLRFDFTKGYGGRHVGEYVQACSPEFSVGEFWETCSYDGEGLSYDQDHHRQRMVNWCDECGGSSAAFDFTTKGILQEAVGRGELWRLVDRKGRPPGLMGVWPSHAVTFLDNHDTGSTQAHWPFPSDKILQGYAYILTHPGTPTVFWDHLFDWGEENSRKIRELVAVRKRADLHSRSEVKVAEARGDLYAAYVDGRVAMKIGQGEWAPPSAGGWKVASFGDGFAVWTKET